MTPESSVIAKTTFGDMFGKRKKQSLYVILLNFYPPFLICLQCLNILQSVVLGFHMVCEGNTRKQCFIDHLNPKKTNPSSLRSKLPTGVVFVRFRHLETLAVDHAILNYLHDTVESVQILDSRPLQKLIVPGNFTIFQLVAEKTQLEWIHFQANDALTSVWIIFSHLQQIPPSLKNLKNLNNIQLKHSFIQHLNLDLLQWCRMLDSLDLSYNNIHTITSTLNSGQRKNLFLLNLSYNQLTTLNLEVLTPLGWFKYVDLSHNKIELVVGRFTSDYLTTITFAHNYLKTLDFCQWLPMPSLQILSLDTNELSRVPNCIHHLLGLSYIRFNNNMLTAVSMDAFGDMDNLTDLDFTSNQISFIIFREDKYPKRLERLVLRENKMQCNDHQDLPFCPLDIEFQPSQSDSSWERNRLNFLKQLIVLT